MSAPNPATSRLLAALSRLPSRRGSTVTDLDSMAFAGWLRRGGWLTECELAVAAEDSWLDELCSPTGVDPVLAMLEELHGVGARARGMAEAARSVVQLQHGARAVALQAITRAARLWSVGLVPTDIGRLVAEGDALVSAVDTTARDAIDQLTAGAPTWAWDEVLDLASQLAGHRSPRRTMSLAVLSSTSSSDPEQARLVLARAGSLPDEFAPAALRPAIWSDPRIMGMTAVDPRIEAQIDMAWRWAINQDSFPSAGRCRWQVLDPRGRPTESVEHDVLAAPAAALLAYIFRLSRRTGRPPRSSAMIATALEPSGLLAALDRPVLLRGLDFDERRRVIIHPDQDVQNGGSPDGSSVRSRSATTIHEAVREIRRSSALRVVAGLVTITLLIAGGIIAGGRRSRASAGAEDRRTFAATLAARAANSRQQAPDTALLEAIAATHLDPSSTSARSSLLSALYGDTRLYRIFRSPEPARVFAFSPDGRWLAMAAYSGVVTMFPTDSSQPSYRLDGHKGAVRALTFSADSTRLAVAGDSGLLSLARAGATRYTSQVPAGVGHVSALAFAPGSTRVVVAGDNRKIAVLSATGSASPRAVGAANGRVSAAVFVSEDLVAVGDDSGAVTVHSLKSGKAVKRWAVRSGITGLAYEPSRNFLYASEFNGTLTVLDQRTARSTTVAYKFPTAVRVMKFGLNLAMISTNGILVVSEDPAEMTRKDGSLQVSDRAYGVHAPVNGLAAVSADGEFVATPSASGALAVWRSVGAPGPPRKTGELMDLRDIPGSGMMLAYSGAVVDPGRLSILTSDGAEIAGVAVQGIVGVTSPVVYSPSRGIAAVREKSKAVALFQVDRDRLTKLAEYPAELEGAQTSALALDDRRGLLLIARGHRLYGVRLSDPTGAEEVLFESPERIVSLAALSGGGYILGRTDGTVAVTPDDQGHVRDGEVRVGYMATMQLASAGPDAFLAAGNNGEVFLYQQADGLWRERQLASHSSRVTDLLVADDLVLSAGRDGKVQISSVGDGALVAEIRMPAYFFPIDLARLGTAVAVIAYGRADTGVPVELTVHDATRVACTVGGWEAAHLTVGDIASDAPASARQISLCS